MACNVFIDVSLCCPFSHEDVLDGIWGLIGSVSDRFPNYFFSYRLGSAWKTEKDPCDILK